MFLTQLTRCHWAFSHWAAVTCRQPGNRVQSGSTSSTRRYSYGCPAGVVISALLLERRGGAAGEPGVTAQDYWIIFCLGTILPENFRRRPPSADSCPNQ